MYCGEVEFVYVLYLPNCRMDFDKTAYPEIHTEICGASSIFVPTDPI
jgi:hypothetical protein